MHYFSTNRSSSPVSFREAVELGQPPDGGLFFPSEIPRLSPDFVASLRQRSNEDIAFEMIRPYVGGEVPDDDLHRICAEAVNFPFPLVELTPLKFLLELFHGPTWAFKDVGARFMSRCLRYFAADRARTTVVIVATSGDTGGAVSAAFREMDGVEVVILYPKGRVSRIQEVQLTAAASNVTTLALRGSFDDCQRLAKQALGDPELGQLAHLTSANSINIARWLPQQFYYAFAIKQWEYEEGPVISVPTGNFGNLAAGILAQRSGLPILGFIAACNSNDVVPRFLETGQYEPRPTVATISNAMDVGDPNNFARIKELLGSESRDLKAKLTATSIRDQDTRETIQRVYRDFYKVLDPHTAVGYRALSDYLSDKPQTSGIVLATADPAKFDVIEDILDNYNVGPKGSIALSQWPTPSKELEPDYTEVRSVILSKT